MKRRLFNPSVVTLVAWACLSPFFFLLLSVLDSHQMSDGRKLWFLFGSLLLWVMLPIGAGLLWKKESRREIAAKPKTSTSPLAIDSLEALRTLSPAGLQSLCLRLFQEMWADVKVQPLPQGLTLLQHQGRRLLLACDAQKTFIGTQEISLFLKSLKQLNCSKGYFVATGLFSFPSLRKAGASPTVELVDAEKLYELVLTFLKKEGESPPTRQPERRRFPRLSLSRRFNQEILKVALSIPYEPSVSSEVKLEDISEGGFCTMVQNADQLPKFFHLTLRLPGLQEPIRTLGELLWRKRQGDESGERCGIAFLSMNGQDRLRLKQFIETEQTVVIDERNKENG